MVNSSDRILAVFFLFLSLALSDVVHAFDIRNHLSTVTRYSAGRNAVFDKDYVPADIPEGCAPIHLNLVARHGTRSPTKKRTKELEGLANHLEVLIKEAKEHGSSLQKVPAWLPQWKSPWKGKSKGGELTIQGEDELYAMAMRIREKFPDLFEMDYHPDIYTIKASQVPRASASAVAFGMGLFSEKGDLGPGKQRAFAVTTESRASDIKLRFHDCCANYKIFRKRQDPAVEKLKEPVLDEITSSLARRYELNFTRQDISSMWFLCKQEASLLNITNQACGLFSDSEALLLEWTDDLELFILKGYGESLNYRMGVPLLEDVLQSMEEAVKAQEEKLTPGSYEKARLRFAHAETVVPFTCLLGLFLGKSEFQQIQQEEPLKLPPKPPQNRNWRGSMVVPFAANNMLVLYSCPANSSNKYFLQVLHNERPIPVAGCDGTDFCPFEDFKEKIVAPHLKHKYDTICNVNTEQQPLQKPETSKFTQIYHWLFSSKKDDTGSSKVEL